MEQINYRLKFIKYKRKSECLNNLFGGNDTVKDKNIYNHVICLLWYNNTKKEILQITKDGEDLKIKEKIKDAYNMFKIKYSNPNVILFVNMANIIDDDIDFFKKNNITYEDINELKVVKNNEKIYKMLNTEGMVPFELTQTLALEEIRMVPFELTQTLTPEEIRAVPVYLCVDMLKILIMYECITEKNYTYVVFSDLDIEDKDSLNNDRLTCSPKRPDFTDEYTPEKIFDNVTQWLLEYYGFVMAGCAKIAPTRFDYNQFKSPTQSQRDFEAENNIIVINGQYFDLINRSYLGENSFMIAKKSNNVIHAIREYFIEYLFCDVIYNIIYVKSTKLNNNYIWTRFASFFFYLNFLNGYNTICLNFDKLSLSEKNLFIKDIDFTDYKDETYKIIKSINLLNYAIKMKGFPEFDDRGVIGDTYLFDKEFNETENGKKVYLDLYTNVYNDRFINNPMYPFKCVKIQNQKNSGF